MPPINWSHVADASSILSAVATIFIAFIVQRFSRRSARQQVRQNINDQLKTYNLAILENEAFAEFTLRTRFPGGGRTLDFVRSLSVVHYRLNILSDIYYAEREHLFRGARRQYGFGDWVRSLARSHRDALAHVLSGAMLVGHSAPFMLAICRELPDDFPGRAEYVDAATKRARAERD